MTQERAVLAGGCFWGMQDLIRKLHGVVATRVGYTGGDVPNATYRNHGTHAEGIEILFDPDAITYPVLDKLRAWCDVNLPQVPPQMATGKALFYLNEQWDKLIRYLEDGRLEIDNNLTENAIRPFVIGRNYGRYVVMEGLLIEPRD